MKSLIKTKGSVFVLILTMLIVPSLMILVPRVYAAGKIHIEPPQIDNTSIGPGSVIRINASAQTVENVFTWQVNVTFNPAVLNCTKAWLPATSIFNFDIDAPPIINNVLGFAVLGSSKISGEGVSGSDVLVSFNFTVVGRGFSWINYSSPYGKSTFILDPALHDIPVTVENGWFNNYVPPPPPPPAKLYIKPPRVVDPTLTPPNTFDINLSITNATDLHSWSANLFYNNTILNATNVAEGDFLKSLGSTTFSFTIQNDYNSTHGKIQLSCALATGEANGNGSLATITFEVLALGESDITITDADLRDSSAKQLPFTTANGYFNNMLIGKLAIDPSEVSGPEYLPGTTFKINVTLDDVESLKICAFNLTYYSSVILEIDINFPPVSGQAPIKKLQVDDEAGYIWANLTYRNGITTYEPVTIMTVEFQVVAMGISPINLTDTQLCDLNSQPITHEVYHGIFIGLIRDVAVIAVVPELNIAYENWTINVFVTVKNKGNVSETFDVKIYYDGNLGGIATVTDLPPNEETNVTIAWNTTGVPCCHNYTISASAGPVPYEFNLADNSRDDGKVKIRIMGDINGNGIVDMLDIGLACDAYGSFPGDSNWNFYADLNRDGTVDLRDIGITCNNYMRTC